MKLIEGHKGLLFASTNNYSSAVSVKPLEEEKMKTVVQLLVLLVVSFTAAGCGSGQQKAPSVVEERPYTIYPGDVLQISVWKEDTLDREVVVLPDGKITFPLIGSVMVRGKTPAEVRINIKDQLERFIPDASVSVVVKADLGHTVSVMGQVVKPGELVMGHSLTVMQALSQAGGLTPYAKASRIIILRKQDDREISIPFPYDDVASGDDLDKDIVLQPGDVVVVPTAGLL